VRGNADFLGKFVAAVRRKDLETFFF